MSKHSLMNFLSQLKIKDWFLKLGGVLSCVGTIEIWWESDATFASLHFSNTLQDLDPSANSLGPKLCSCRT